MGFWLGEENFDKNFKSSVSGVMFCDGGENSHSITTMQTITQSPHKNPGHKKNGTGHIGVVWMNYVVRTIAEQLLRCFI